jgi:hypothetical protein
MDIYLISLTSSAFDISKHLNTILNTRLADDITGKRWHGLTRAQHAHGHTILNKSIILNNAMNIF